MGYTSFQTLAYRLLVGFEGFRDKPYKDYKQWSIGYGSFAGRLMDDAGKLLQPVLKAITKDDAVKKLVGLIDQYDVNYVSGKLKVEQTEKQKAALISLAYNIPVGALAVIALINQHRPIEEIRAKWLQYHFSGGVSNPDLYNRRVKEYEYYKTA